MGASKERRCGQAAIVALAVLLAGCGGGGGIDGGGTNPPPGVGTGTGGLGISIQDAPLDNLVKFEITVVAITLNPGSVSVLPSPKEIELTSLQLQPQLIRLASNVPAGSYTSVTLQLQNAEIKFCPESLTCTAQTVVEREFNQTFVVSRNVNLTVTNGQTLGLLVDFDLAASITQTANDITGVNPTFSVSVVNLASQQDEFEGTGRVVSVNRQSATAGTFALEVFGPCQQVTVTVDANTEFEDFADDFNSLAANQIVEVDADLQTGGTLLAKDVELEESEQGNEAEGVILSVDRNSTTQEVNSFTLVLHEVLPCSVSAPANDLVSVTVDAGTEFRIDDDGLSLSAALFNDPTDLDVGQKVEVDPTGSLGISITAEKIKLKDLTIRGTVNGTPTPPDFELDPASELFPDASISVETFSDTEFDGVSGVSGLVDGRAVRVRGLLFRAGAGQQRLAAKKVRAE
jgi:hypothetical protein